MTSSSAVLYTVLVRLCEGGVTLVRVQGSLVVQAENAIPPALTSLVHQHRADLIAFLSGEVPAQWPLCRDAMIALSRVYYTHHLSDEKALERLALRFPGLSERHYLNVWSTTVQHCIKEERDTAVGYEREKSRLRSEGKPIAWAANIYQETGGARPSPL